MKPNNKGKWNFRTHQINLHTKYLPPFSIAEAFHAIRVFFVEVFFSPSHVVIWKKASHFLSVLMPIFDILEIDTSSSVEAKIIPIIKSLKRLSLRVFDINFQFVLGNSMRSSKLICIHVEAFQKFCRRTEEIWVVEML